MNQINVTLIGDEKTGKKTFLNLLSDNSENDIQNSLYFPVNIQDHQSTFNFFLTKPGLKNLNKTLQKVMISDVLIFFYDLIEDEDDVYQDINSDEQNDNEYKETQLNKYKSIIEPIFECLFHLNMQKRIIILLNKIDHPQVDYSEDVIHKAIDYFKNIFNNNYLNFQDALIVPISALKNENVTQLLEGQKFFFFEALLNLSDNILNKKRDAIEDYLPLRISVLQVHKIIGAGIVAQGIVLSDTIKTNDELIILPSQKRTKVKELQVYNEQVNEGQVSQIIGINLQGISYDDVQKGYVLVKADQWTNKSIIETELILKANFINTFNGIYPGFQLNLIGYNMKIPCFVQKIINKVDFINNEIQKTTEDEEIAEKGSVCTLSVQIFKSFFLEKFEDFSKLGKFIIVESNVILGFAEIIGLNNQKQSNQLCMNFQQTVKLFIKNKFRFLKYIILFLLSFLLLAQRISQKKSFIIIKIIFQIYQFIFKPV